MQRQIRKGASHPASMFELIVDPALPEDACREGKQIFSEAVDETDCRVTVWGVSAFLMTPYTRQFKKVPTLALALNCSCSALEFK